ncbi:unnamed protein product [Linum trigynum]|uniref:Uncharacterized protein n=1 Tax=Linum trigynum TaxID=586398 RepID=A0AAV2CNB7_9ROSI
MALIKAACFLFFFALLDSYVSAVAPTTAPATVAPTHAPVTPTPVAHAPLAPVSGNYCVAKCQDRCKTHPSAKRFCQKICTRCCMSCKCVPTGPIGSNAEQCKNWTATLYHGVPYKCP